MTTTQVEALANTDRVGKGLDLQFILRTECISEFWEDVGAARWKNLDTTITLIANTRTVTTPTDLGKVLSIAIPPQGTSFARFDDEDKLKYIGEDATRVLEATMNTRPGKPSGYWFTKATNVNDSFSFDPIPDAAYTAYLHYESRPVFEDYTSEVDLDTLMPHTYQIGLVKSLRKFLLLDRFGQSDPRYDRAVVEYDRWIERTRGRGKDAALRNHVVTL